MREDARAGGAVLALAALTALLFRDILFRGHALYERDILLMVYSQAESFAQCILKDRSWPVWDPRVGFGLPMLANPGAQVLYPWTWLNLLCQPETFYTIYVTGHLLLSGVGLQALGRRLGLSVGASLTAAAVWMLCGPLLSLVSLWQHFAGAAWMPWVLLAAEAALASPRARSCLLWGAALASQILTGSVEMCVIGGLLQAGLVVRHLRGKTGPEVLRTVAAPAAGALALAVALTAGVWLPAFELLRASSRTDLPEGLRAFWSLHPVNLLQVLLPVFPHHLPLLPEVRALLFEGREPYLNSLYLGLAALPLVAASLVGPRWKLAGLLSAGGTVAALVALGKFGLAYPLATALLPPLRIFRYPSKAMIVAGLAWALLAGLGYDAWRDPAAGSRRRWGLLVLLPTVAVSAATLVLAVLASTSAGTFLSPDPSGRPFTDVLAPTVGRLLVVGSLAGAAAALTAARAFLGRSPGPLAAAVALVVVADLFFVHRPLNPTAPRDLVFRRPAVLSALRLEEATTRVYVFDYFLHVLGKTYRRRMPSGPKSPPPPGLPPGLRSTLLTQDFLSPPAGQRWGLYGSYDYDWLSLYPRALRNLTLFLRAKEETPDFARLLRLGGVSYVVALHREGLDDLLPLATVESPFAGSVHVFAVPDHLPRTYVVSGTRVSDGLPALRMLVEPAFDPSREVLVPQGDDRAPALRPVGESHLVAYRPDRVRIEASLEEPGLLVLLDAYDPGWSATVDGQPAPVLRANVAFRAVAVPAGRHLVEMRYRPRSVTVGLLISACAFLAGLSVLLRTRPTGPGATP